MTEPSEHTPAERRDMAAALARGLSSDLDAVGLGRIIADAVPSTDPAAFGPLPDNPTSDDRLRAQAARVLGELLYAATLLALGLHPSAGPSASRHLNAGLNRVATSPLLRHLAECPGTPDSGTAGEDREAVR